MASAWGKSWGRAWGNSWGSVADTTGGARKNDDDWFKYHSLEEWRRKGKEEFGPPVVEAEPAVPAETPVSKTAPAKVAAGKWKNALDGTKASRKPDDGAAISLPSLQITDAGFAFPADRKLTDDEAITLLLLLSET
jgi:hypothetical protein